MLIVASTALLLSVLVWFNYSAVLPLVVDEWGLSGLRAGAIFGAFQAGYLLAILGAGNLADRYPARWVIGGGATLAGLTSLGFAFLADGFVLGAALRLLSGVGMAGVYVPGMRFLASWYEPDVRGRAIGIYAGTFSIGGGLSFAVASAVASSVGWRTAIAVTSVGALIVGPLVLGLARESPDRTTRTSGSLHQMVGLLRNRPYLTAVGVYAFHNWELFGAWNWTVAFLVTVPALAGTGAGARAGLLAGGMMVVGGIGNAVGGTLSDRLGRERVIGANLLASAGLSLVIGRLAGLPLWALGAVVLVYGIVLVADSSPTSAAITEVTADERVGSALALQSLVGFIPTAISPVVFGAALDRGGYALAFPTLALGALAGLVMLAAFVRLRNDARVDQPTTA